MKYLYKFHKFQTAGRLFLCSILRTHNTAEVSDKENDRCRHRNNIGNRFCQKNCHNFVLEKQWQEIDHRDQDDQLSEDCQKCADL